MNKKWILYFLVLLLSIDKNLAAREPDLPELLRMQSVDQTVIGWRWRAAFDNKVYPYLRIQVNQLSFLNSEGEIICQAYYLPNSRVVTSKDQAFVGFIDIDEQFKIPEDFKGTRSVRYQITNYAGEEIYALQLEVPYDDPIPALYLANNGQSILADGYKGIVKIFQSNGMPLEEIDLFDDDILDYEKPISCDIADSGEIFAILAQKRPMSFDPNASAFISGEPYLFCFSLDGGSLLRKPLELITAAEAAISPSGNFMVVSQYTPDQQKKSTIINLNGKVVLEIPALFRYTQFSTNDSLLLLADKKILFKIDLKKLIYTTSNIINPDEDRMVAEIFFAEMDRKILILTANSAFQHGRFEYTEPELMEFNQAGERLWVFRFNNETFITPSIFSNGIHLGLGFESNYQIYKEHRE